MFIFHIQSQSWWSIKFERSAMFIGLWQPCILTDAIIIIYKFEWYRYKQALRYLIAPKSVVNGTWVKRLSSVIHHAFMRWRYFCGVVIFSSHEGSPVQFFIHVNKTTFTVFRSLLLYWNTKQCFSQKSYDFFSCVGVFWGKNIVCIIFF